MQVSSQKIVPFLWFNNEAEEAANFYVSVFGNGSVDSISRYGEGTPFPKGTAMSVEFTVHGLRIYALNAGPQFPFTPAVSLFVHCNDQAEVDDLWSKLTADGGKEQPCGWLVDRFGLSWQIIPARLGELLRHSDAAKARRAMQAMMKMKKIEIAELEKAVDAIS